MTAADATAVIALIGGVGMVGGILYAAATGRRDRDEEEAARVYFDEHGHWPDEAPDDAELPPGVRRA